MRILTLSNLYPPDFIGGYEIVCAQVVDALRAAGHNVLVLTSAPRSPVPAPAHVHRLFRLTNIYDFGWNAKTGPLVKRLDEVQSSFINAFNVHILLTALAAFNPDVVYLHNIEGLGGLALVASLHHLRVPWVWQIGDEVPRALCRRNLYERCLPTLVHEYNRQIRGRYLACSRRVVAEIETDGLRISDQVDLIPNWIQGERAPARERFFDGSLLRIVTAGQIAPCKGIDLLIESASILQADGRHSFSVDIYGRVETPNYQAQIDKLRLRERVTLMGKCPHAELLQRFRGYDIFAFPTWRREPFGIAPLEAAGQGCVSVISECCGIAEWLMHGVHCLKARRTPEAFAQVIADILDRRIDLAPIGRRIQPIVWRDFHIDTVLPQIERALAQAARTSRSGAGSPDEAYHLALLAERMAQVLVHESFAA
jgi:glycosyltransferase involved in cell wall biosynthesis